jgi:hypothetical protein
MGSIRVHEFTTLDGVINEPSWTFEYGFDPTMGAALAGAMADCQGILLGRTTYEMFEPAWSARTGAEDPGAPFMNDTMKYHCHHSGATRPPMTSCTLYSRESGVRASMEARSLQQGWHDGR